MKLPIYYNVWMDNGIENLYRILKSVDNNIVELHETYMEFAIPSGEKKKDFLKKLKEEIENKRDSVIFVMSKDKKTGIHKKTKKNFILLQPSQNKGENTLKEKIYSPDEMEKRIEEIFNSIEIRGENVCVMCNKSYSKSVDKLKQAVYPMVTKIKSLSGVRDMKEYYDNLCPLCYLVGTLEWTDECIVYRCRLGSDRHEYSIALLPDMCDLKALYNFKERYRINLDDDPTSNIKICIKRKGYEEAKYCEGKYTLLIAFFEKFFNNVYLQIKEGSDWDDYSKIREEICKNWACIEIPSRGVKDIKYSELSLSDSFLSIIYEISKELEGDGGVYSRFIDKIFFKSTKPINSDIERKINDEIKENIGESIVKDDFRKFAHTMLPRKEGYIVVPPDANILLKKLIDKWIFKKMKMNESDIENIKKAGETIAVLAEENLNLIYSIDKSKNSEEFLRALEQASKRLLRLDDEKKDKHKMFLYPPALGELTEKVLKAIDNQKSFKVIRDSLIVFACVTLSKINYIEDKNK